MGNSFSDGGAQGVLVEAVDAIVTIDPVTLVMCSVVQCC